MRCTAEMRCELPVSPGLVPRASRRPYSDAMDMEGLPDPDALTEYDRGWIAGWLTARHIEKPTVEQFREALLALVALQTQASTAHH